ncbi:hypothetical protein SAMN04515671_2418 [Nakamurella panacisegetis]|uniref:Heparin binding hemagglutinin HbhA n=1 Tax=Nakamurella panacisegetis TaxID=1090615 RepID=A0A1H0NMN2_9ACTN|nr:hypothetical protein [Nakamurella panacisegetis]SDO94012.1 hypothetical protein SAMN04515671_2418 [Nakamurella panacisegetis]
MSLITDIRAVSENAVEQLAARFSDLPRPLLAAIGAGDMAVARLADLRESLSESIGDRVSPPSLDVTDVRSAAADLGAKVVDLPSKAQKVAADVAGSIESFAAEAPAKAQELISTLPDKLAELQAAAQSLSPDAVRETLEAYTQLAGMIYGNLADRGDKTWNKVRATGLHPGAVVDAVAARTRPAKAPAAKAPAAKAPAAKATAAKVPAAKAPAAKVPAAKAPAVRAPRAKVTPVATPVATPKPRAPRAATPKATGAGAPKASAAKATPRAAARKRVVKPAGSPGETPIVITPATET